MKQMRIDHIVADFPYLANKVKIDLDSATSRIVAFGQVYGGTIAVLAAKMFDQWRLVFKWNLSGCGD